MKLPRLNVTERMIFTSVFAAVYADHPPKVDNEAAEQALEDALWAVANFRQALRQREED